MAPYLLTDPESAAANWTEAKRRVLSSYREWLRGVRFTESPERDSFQSSPNLIERYPATQSRPELGD